MVTFIILSLDCDLKHALYKMALLIVYLIAIATVVACSGKSVLKI
jgi:hypothetical protein